MREDAYREDEVCIVGVGCVLPEADTVAEFWNNLIQQKCSIREMSSDLGESGERSRIAAYVEPASLARIATSLGSTYAENTAELLTIEATRQAVACLHSGGIGREKKTAIFLGNMDLDDAYPRMKTYCLRQKELETYLREHSPEEADATLAAFAAFFNTGEDREAVADTVLATSTLARLKKHFGLAGEGALVDAACASSLAALERAVRALASGEVDVCITGGFESNLSPSSFAVFEAVGALSPTPCLPFDTRSGGVSQGEGAVTFILKRIADAQRDGDTIYGVIRGIGSSSDGRVASLFSPSSAGQVLAMERAYSGLERERVAYVECHGTGTTVGDATEIQSVNAFFERPLPVGSVKSLIGHTKSTAGSAALLKVLLLMQHRHIPGTSYVEREVGEGGFAYLPKESLELPDGPLRMGVSSFGFGNINYHVVVDTYRSDLPVVASEMHREREIVRVAESSICLTDPAIRESAPKIGHVPPASVPHIDQLQLAALLAVERAFATSSIDPDTLDTEESIVVSGIPLGIDTMLDIRTRIGIARLQRQIPAVAAPLAGYLETLGTMTPDTSPGSLNNCIAGRVANAFDLRGKNLNIDADFNSAVCALRTVQDSLPERGFAVVLYADEEINREQLKLERKHIFCEVYTTVSYAKEKSLPILRALDAIHYHER